MSDGAGVIRIRSKQFVVSDQGNKKSRRRFLADMLFLGGGLTAAGLLAKTQIATEPDVQASPSPQSPGNVALPDKQCPPTPDTVTTCPPTPQVQSPGAAVAPPPKNELPPGAQGEYMAPTPVAPPKLDPRDVPNPAGGMRPPPPPPPANR